MNRTRLSVPKMDCAAEERLVRMALEGRPEVRRLDADLGARQIVVTHEGDANQIADLVRPLNLGVIVAAGLVGLASSNVPDLVVATVIALVVLNGAVRILRLKR